MSEKMASGIPFIQYPVGISVKKTKDGFQQEVILWHILDRTGTAYLKQTDFSPGWQETDIRCACQMADMPVG
jgi:hypothetical protein